MVIRETFEETGIWLGDGIMLEASREALMSSTASFRDVLATAEACLNLDCLYPWSWWSHQNRAATVRYTLLHCVHRRSSDCMILGKRSTTSG